MGSRRSTPVFRRMWDKFTIGDGCWEWTAYVHPTGYGQLGADGGRGLVYAHRALWEHLRGPVPEGLELDHLCRNRACVRPDHLEAVSHAENLSRAVGGAPQVQREKTHCPKGHPYDEKNTRIVYDKQARRHRQCIECHKAASLSYVQRKKGRLNG